MQILGAVALCGAIGIKSPEISIGVNGILTVRTAHPRGWYDAFALHNQRYPLCYMVTSGRKDTLCTRYYHRDTNRAQSDTRITSGRIAFFHRVLAQTQEV